ncbi:hypothetical protein DBDeUG_0569 [Chlamydia pecorum]|uniref:hypothetical protein n=1 Tax=Chlamydia pecorum TaxID=85991 RepID=UPI0003D3F988|nr:hypothetical protein [Chlamydia pecorum]ETF37870.1 hypothetical protein CpecF_0554 [Chlamydia pecorum DBDeUG]UBV33076.1 hypothetical protein DBDeUG_0569 [Chlamydia pecorum]
MSCFGCPCPGGSCSLNYTGWGSSPEESISLSSSGSTPPITTQPGRAGGKEKHLELKLSWGDDSVLSLIEKSGRLFDSFLKSPRVQRTTRYCNETGTPWCKEHCPSLCNWIWGCCCSCCDGDDSLNPLTPEQAREFLQEMKDKYGVIVVGATLGSGGGEVLLQAQGNDPNAPWKQAFEDLCLSTHQELNKKLNLQISKELYEEVSKPENAPPIDAPIVKAVEEAKDDPTAPSNLPTFWVLYDDGEAQEGAQSAGGSSLPICKQAVRLNFSKLQAQLSRAFVTSVSSGYKYKGPLGEKAVEVVDLLKKVLSSLTKDSRFLNIEGTGLSLNKELYLQVLALCVFAVGYIPLDKQAPDTMPFNPLEPSPWALILDLFWGTATEVDRSQDDDTTDGAHGGGSGSETTPLCFDDGNEIWGPEDQEALLGLAHKVHSFVLG